MSKDDAIATAFAAGQAAWSGVAVAADRFAAHAARFAGAASLHADLYLACALTSGDRAAILRFEAQILAETASYIRRVDGAGDLVDEVRQRLRERLLVGKAGGTPRIAEYSGRGPLGAWVRVAAVRVTIDLLRERGREATGREVTDETAVDNQLDPEAKLLRARYRADYEEALRGALGALSAKDRNLLRMYFVDGMTVQRIGAVYSVNRATVSRWIHAVRRQLLDDTYQRLGERLRLSPSEFASLAAVVQSQLQLSLSGILKASPPRGDGG